MDEFRWNAWNVTHIGEHGVVPAEAEEVVEGARKPYPRRLGEGKYLARGRTAGGAYLQVVYVFDPSGRIYVIHARPLTPGDKRRYRRETRS